MMANVQNTSSTPLARITKDMPVVLSPNNPFDRKQADRSPNIRFILADGLGEGGDVSHYNPESKMPTSNLAELADYLAP
jgi:hypothetical protein